MFALAPDGRRGGRDKIDGPDPKRSDQVPVTSELITGVDFLGLPTHDLEAAVEFYGTTLGLPRSVYMPQRHFAEFETGNLTLNIMDATAMGLEHNTSRVPVALHVDDVATVRATLEERGVTFEGGTFDTGVCHMAFFSDPDGNALMLHHRYVPRVTEA
jgi:predicted enzyme related to lactoylglutathione lyase